MPAEKPTQATPRWLFRFFDWMRSTPFNGVLLAFVFFLLGAGLWHGAAWQFGTLARYQVDTQLVLNAVWPPFVLLVWILLDNIARRAITDFADGLGNSQQTRENIYNNFISLGTIPGIVLLVTGLVLGYTIAAMQAEAYGIEQPALVLVLGILPMMMDIIVLSFPVRLFRQLFLVNALYRKIGKINLFNLRPVYALSRYGYSVALLIILNAVLVDIVNGLSGQTVPYRLPSYIYTVVLAFVVFFAPLIGINRRLSQEKEKVLQNLGNELNGLYGEITIAARKRKSQPIASLSIVSQAIEKQIEKVQKVATWPWHPGSLRNLLLPITLPLLVAIMQRYVLNWLGF